MFKTIYHLSHTDLDGYGCQAIVDMTMKCKVFYGNANYGLEVMTMLESIFSSILSTRHRGEMDKILVLITDLNLTDEQAEYVEENRLFHKNVEVVLLDHHISGKDVALKYDWYHLDTTKSGTVLTYEFLTEKFGIRKFYECELLCSVVNAYDLWEEDNEFFARGKIASYYLNTIDKFVPRRDFEECYSQIVRRFVSTIGDKWCGEYDHDEELYLKMRKAIMQFSLNYSNDYELEVKTLQDATEVFTVIDILDELNSYESFQAGVLTNVSVNEELVELGLMIYITKNSISSSVMNKVLKIKRSYKAIAVVNENGNVALRSTGKLDVSELAKCLGGGGHKNAAGCKIQPRSAFDEYKQPYIDYILKEFREAVKKLHGNKE